MATPQALCEALSFESKHFQSVGELTKYIHDVSREYRVPYSASRTSALRPIQLFTCRFGRRVSSDSTAKTGCQSFVKYMRLENGNYSLLEANFIHNHSLDRTFIEAQSNCCSHETMEKMKRQQELQVPPGQIRANLDIISPSSMFYNMRRDVIIRDKLETFETFLQSLASNEFASAVGRSQDGTLQRFTVVNKRVSMQQYSRDVFVTDNTSNTNYYNMGLQIIVVIDSEGKSQILSFGCLAGQDEESYFQFFSDTYELTGILPRVVVLDRSLAQCNAIKRVFPGALVVFCSRHLGKDLEKYFDRESDIVKGFYDIQKNFERSYEYLELIVQTLNEMPEDMHGKQILKWLADNSNSWLPVRLIEQGILFEWTSNRAEGIFGAFKQRFGFRMFKLKDLVINLLMQCRTLIVESCHTYTSTNKHYQTLPFVQLDDIPRIGKLALDQIAKEVLAFCQGKECTGMCPLCALRNSFPDLALPCRHILHEDMCITAGHLNPRYLRADYEAEEENIPIKIKATEPRKHSNSYTDIMSAISPYASMASRNKEIDLAFCQFIARLNGIEGSVNQGMPTTVSVRGRFPCHPARNVILGGNPKSKRIYTCSKCHRPGYNSRNCPRRVVL